MPPATPWKLNVREPGRPPRELPLVDGMTFGRHESNDCVLISDSWVSKRHARIVELEGRFFLEDLGSSNGTRIEGGPKLERGVKQALGLGTRFLLGKTLIEIVLASTAKTSRRLVVPPLEPPPIAAEELPDPDGGDAILEPVGAPPEAEGRASSGGGDVPRDAGAGRKRRVETARIPVAELRADPGALAAWGGRLVICGDGDAGIVAIDKERFVLGRGGGGRHVDHRIDEEGVSGAHAEVFFDGSRFWIEDLGSTNGTIVGGSRIQAGRPEPLAGGSHIRLGSVDLVLLTRLDRGGSPIPESVDAATLRLLTTDDAAVSEARERALVSGHTISEEVLLAGAVDPEPWSRAYARAREAAFAGMALPRGARLGSRRVVLLLAAILAVLVAIAGLLAMSALG